MAKARGVPIAFHLTAVCWTVLYQCDSLSFFFLLYTPFLYSDPSTIKGSTATDLELPLILYVFTTLCVGWTNSILRSPLLPHLSVIVSSYWLRARIFPFFFPTFSCMYNKMCILNRICGNGGKRMKRNWEIPASTKSCCDSMFAQVVEAGIEFHAAPKPNIP